MPVRRRNSRHGREILLLFLLFFFSQWLAVFVFDGVIYGLGVKISASSRFLWTSLASSLLTLLVFLVYFGFFEGPWRSLGLGRPPSWRRTLLYGIWGGAGAFAAASLLGAFSQYLLSLVGLPPYDQQVTEVLRRMPALWEQGILTGVIVILAPLTEEILFRGLLFQSLRQRWPVGAFFLSSALFGLLHLDPLRFLPLTAVGFVFAWVYAKSRSLYSAIIAHMLLNGFMVATLYLG